ncbi:MAG: TAT-variant-translocated molybdopterin oxidoreductase, partial [Candidatus Binatia bacterium]
MKKEPLNLPEIRERLGNKKGKDFWRSLEELADTDEFRELLEREFPRQASVWSDGVGRRDFLRLMAASLALAGLSACAGPSRTDEKIVPYVTQPEEIVPGKPLIFATAFTHAGRATGLLVESHEGRPTKIEGNPNHPASLGATDALAQASILALYDPDRSQVVSNAGRVSTRGAFLSAVHAELELQRSRRGAGIRLLTETVATPTLAHQLREFLKLFPDAKWRQYEPVNRDNPREGSRLAFGQDVEAQYRFDRAELILALDADFLFSQPGSVRYAREFAAQRRVHEGKNTMNRLYVIEPTPSLTGAMADHRWAVPASRMEALARALARRAGIRIDAAPDEESFLRDYPW